MLQNKLMLNDGKTEFLIIGTRQQLVKVSADHITVGNAEVKSSSGARNLGVWFDNVLNMENHVTRMCKSSFYYLYNLRKIRKYLSKQTTEKLVHAFVTSRLDYCNSLLYGMPACLINKLQRVQNAAARLITKSSRFEHINPTLYDLHWLPVRYRINFKILMIVHKCVYGNAPSYLKDLVSVKVASRYYTRSDDMGLLLILPSFKSMATLGDRSFSLAAPTLWNILPINIRETKDIAIFKSILKTYFFKLAFKQNIVS